MTNDIRAFQQRHESLMATLQELYPCMADHVHRYPCYTDEQIRSAHDPTAPRPPPSKPTEVARLLRDIAAQIDSGSVSQAFERMSLTLGPAGAGFYFRIEGVVR